MIFIIIFLALLVQWWMRVHADRYQLHGWNSLCLHTTACISNSLCFVVWYIPFIALSIAYMLMNNAIWGYLLVFAYALLALPLFTIVAYFDIQQETTPQITQFQAPASHWKSAEIQRLYSQLYLLYRYTFAPVFCIISCGFSIGLLIIGLLSLLTISCRYSRQFPIVLQIATVLDYIPSRLFCFLIVVVHRQQSSQRSRRIFRKIFTLRNGFEETLNTAISETVARFNLSNQRSVTRLRLTIARIQQAAFIVFIGIDILHIAI